MLLFGSVLLLGCDDAEDAPPDVGYVKVFLTTFAYAGNRGGLAGADTNCTEAAHNAGQTGDWTAWLSDNTTNAADRIVDGGARYQLLNGTVVANNKADLLDGTLDNPILIDEFGNTVNGAFEVWTATAADGINPGVGSCIEWTTADPVQRGQIGRADNTDANWTDVGGGDTCDTFNRFYCFANVISN